MNRLTGFERALVAIAAAAALVWLVAAWRGQAGGVLLAAKAAPATLLAAIAAGRLAAPRDGLLALALALHALTGALFLGLLASVLEGATVVAVPLYVVGLLAMAGSALLAGRGQPLVGLGALLFVASDALLAVELFLGGFGGAGGARGLSVRLLVWPLYVGAQLALALGWVRGGVASGAGVAQPAR